VQLPAPLPPPKDAFRAPQVHVAYLGDMRDSIRVLILTSKLADYMQTTSHRISPIPAARLEYLPCHNGHSRRRTAVTEPTDVEIAVWLLGPPTQDSFPKWAFKLCVPGAYPLSLFCEEKLRNLLNTHSPE